MLQCAELGDGRLALQAWVPTAAGQHEALGEQRTEMQVFRGIGGDMEHQIDITLLRLTRNPWRRQFNNRHAGAGRSLAQAGQRRQQYGCFAVVGGGNAPCLRGLGGIERMLRRDGRLQRGQRLAQRFAQ